MWRYFTINTVSELICSIIALICLSKDKNKVWCSWIVFLILICITELAGINIKIKYIKELDYLKAHPHFQMTVKPNVWIYNILLLFQASFISLLFDNLLKRYINSKPLITIGLAIFSMLYIYELIQHGPFIKHNITTTVLAVIFIIYSFNYFYLLLEDDNYLDLKYSAEFWWVSGTLLFYFGSIASLIFFQILTKLDPHFEVTVPIYKILNIILYSCWSYSFICRRWLTTTSKS